MGIRVNITSVFVDDQAKALDFYTDMLGFVPRADEPVGAHRWLTVVAPDDTDGTQLLLEPNDHPAAKAFTAALVADGIPATSFEVDDLAATHEQLVARGVRFTTPPTSTGKVDVAVLDDTCGNLIMLTSPA